MRRQTHPLSQTLLAAARCLASVESGGSLTESLGSVAPEARSAVQAVAFYAMRHWGLARAWRGFALRQLPTDKTLASLTALSLLLMDVGMVEAGQAPPDSWQCPLGPDAPRYAPHTLVDQAVRAVRLATLPPASAGLINAVLRRFQRERATFVLHTERDAVARWGYPRWWQEAVMQAYPNQWQQVLLASQTPPALVLRVNRRRATVAEVVAALEGVGAKAHACGDTAVVVEAPGAVERLPGFEQGWWSVQDLAAQRAAPLLGLSDGLRVLDACAAPGGKTAHILELANVELTALDASGSRLARVKQNLQRLGLLSDRVRLAVADARHTQTWWNGQPFDVILADVPCTASGVVRRHPDIAWLRRQSDVMQAAKLATDILDALWSTLAPGGRLLLVTCSVFSEEGERQAAQLLARHRDARRLTCLGQRLPMPNRGLDHPGEDGFFYALFQQVHAN